MLSFKNWRKPANKLISDIANILIILNAGLIPSVLYLPISDNLKCWIIGGYNVIASLINIYKKLSKINEGVDLQLITK